MKFKKILLPLAVIGVLGSVANAKGEEGKELTPQSQTRVENPMGEPAGDGDKPDWKYNPNYTFDDENGDNRGDSFELEWGNTVFGGVSELVERVGGFEGDVNDLCRKVEIYREGEKVEDWDPYYLRPGDRVVLTPEALSSIYPEYSDSQEDDQLENSEVPGLRSDFNGDEKVDYGDLDRFLDLYKHWKGYQDALVISMPNPYDVEKDGDVDPYDFFKLVEDNDERDKLNPSLRFAYDSWKDRVEREASPLEQETEEEILPLAPEEETQETERKNRWGIAFGISDDYGSYDGLFPTFRVERDGVWENGDLSLSAGAFFTPWTFGSFDWGGVASIGDDNTRVGIELGSSRRERDGGVEYPSILGGNLQTAINDNWYAMVGVRGAGLRKALNGDGKNRIGFYAGVGSRF